MSIINSTGPSTFKGLTDSPSSYVGQSGQQVAVNSSENGVEFVSRTVSFSYDQIETALTIPIYQQMIVYQSILLNDTLTINGKIVLTD